MKVKLPLFSKYINKQNPFERENTWGDLRKFWKNKNFGGLPLPDFKGSNKLY